MPPIKQIGARINETAYTRARQSVGGPPKGDGNEVAVAIADKIKYQIEYVMTKTRNWSTDAEDARKRAEQRVKAAQRKEREKQAQEQEQAQWAPNY